MGYRLTEKNPAENNTAFGTAESNNVIMFMLNGGLE